MSKDSILLFKKLSKKKSTIKKLTAAQIVDTYHDIVQFTKQPLVYFKLKSFRIWFTRYYAPADVMANVCFAEFVMADTCLSRYMLMNEDPEWLDKLVAILYRPNKWFWFIRKYFDDGDVRQKYDDKHYNSYPKFKNLSNRKKLVILHAFMGCRITIMKRCPNLFPQKVTVEEDENTEQKVKDAGPVWKSIRFDTAESSVFPDLESVDYANVYTVLDYLEKKTLDNIKLQEKYREMNKK